MVLQQTPSYGGYLQFLLTTGQIQKNFSALKELLEKVSFPSGSLVVLPELFLTGFAYSDLTDLYLEQCRYEQKLCDIATAHGLVLAGSLLESSQEGLFFNCLKLFGNNRVIANYKKSFLFPGEEQGFLASSAYPEPIQLGDLRVGFLVCYDLRFPHLARLQAQQGATVLICPAQWPRKRIEHWRTLVVARAIENQCYFIGCNGLGWNNDVELGGHSLVVDPAGTVVQANGFEPGGAVTALADEKVQHARNDFISFSLNPMELRFADKQKDSTDAIQKLKERKRIGLRVTCSLLQKPVLDQCDVEKLERYRAGSDFQAIVLLDEENVYRVAALGCVDMVFVWQHSLSQLKEQLSGCCFFANLH